MIAISNLNTYNFLFIMLGLLLHWRPKRFSWRSRKSVPATGGVLIQFPFYGAIAAILTTGEEQRRAAVSDQIADAFVSHVDAATAYPLVIGVYSAVLGFFIPSGGGKWLLEAPYVMQAANDLKVHLGWAVQVYNAAEALPNLINPFWMLPLLGVLGLRARAPRAPPPSPPAGASLLGCCSAGRSRSRSNITPPWSRERPGDRHETNPDAIPGLKGGRSHGNAIQVARAADAVRHGRRAAREKPRPLVAVSPGTTVLAALREMNEQHVALLVVLDKDALAGVVAERDIARRVVLEQRSAKDTAVRDIMTTRVHTVAPETKVPECVMLMHRERIRHLPVVSAGKRARGAFGARPDGLAHRAARAPAAQAARGARHAALPLPEQLLKEAFDELRHRAARARC